MPLVYLVFAVFFSAFLLTGLIRLLAEKLKLVDRPVSRSAHVLPVPVAGGIAIALPFFFACLYLFFIKLIDSGEFVALGVSLVIALTGLVDDLRQLDVKWRMPIQFAAAVWVLLWLGNIPAINMFYFTLEIPWVLNALGVFALVWLLNLYNFMDGIDGLAGTEAVFACVIAFSIAINSSDVGLGAVIASLGAASVGFLLWNWPPAKIFMGDVGSGFLGFVLGIIAIISLEHGTMSVWTWVLLLGVFISDTSVTLWRRYTSGERWYEGHNTHCYQKMAKRYKSHGKVTITVLLINCLWLAPLAFYSIKEPKLGIVLAILGVVPLVITAIRLEAGKPEALAHNG